MYIYNYIPKTVIQPPSNRHSTIPVSLLHYAIGWIPWSFQCHKPKIKWMIKRGVPSGKLTVNGIINGIVNNGILKVTLIVN